MNFPYIVILSSSAFEELKTKISQSKAGGVPTDESGSLLVGDFAFVKEVKPEVKKNA